MRSIVKHVALLCLLLMFWSAVAFVAHHHSKGADSAKCTVCVSAHTVAPKATAHVVKATFTTVSSLRTDPVSVKHLLVVFALSVRPPPAI
jgi:hypothetical protein